MLDYRNILRVGSDPTKSMRTMELELRSSHHTIRKVLDAAGKAGISWPLSEDCTNEMLMELLFPEEYQKAALYVLPDYAYIHAELARKGVNLAILWEEYCAKCQSEGTVPYMYTQYCEKYRQSVGQSDKSHHAHSAQTRRYHGGGLGWCNPGHP